ncbi:MAG: SURF1 family protein [Methylotenera sp.]|nr:SURF1 family protein [Methylotenera sp.]
MKQLQFRIHQYVFSPSLLGTLLTIICIPLFIKFGLWQYHKAEQKQLIQNAYNQAKTDSALPFPLNMAGKPDLLVEDWKYKKVKVTGTYEIKYQFLLDNQVEDDRVGYHVITPLKIENTKQYVLVNRGWILAKDDHSELPVFDTPNEIQEITGQVWVPSKKTFSLEDKSVSTANEKILQPVWQNMNIAKYQRLVPFAVSPLAIKLDVQSEGGGFVRNWQVPVERIATNMGYAYQWFGFALATLLIFIYMSVSKVGIETKQD